MPPGTGSLWIGGDVNAGTAGTNTRKIGRIVVPTYADPTLGATLLGFDSNGDDSATITNRTYDTVSFGGMKKITNATSPMGIVFCVASERSATAANKKVYPLEMDANAAKFNVQPKYGSYNLVTTNDLATVATSGSYNDLSNKLVAGTDYIAPPSSPSSGNVLTYNGSAWTASAPATELPTQTGNSGKFLTTNGSAVSWANAPTEIPTQTGNSGKFLTTNGSAVSWASAPTEIPTQTGNSGKFLTTNGSAVSWGSVSGTLPSVSSTDNGKFLKVVNGAWAAASLPTYNGGVS